MSWPATCPGQPCLTLTEYLNNTAQYFTSNTSFWFLEGEHYLETTLLLNGITNLTMSGTDGSVRIMVSAGDKVVCVDSDNIKLSSLEVAYFGNAENRSKSALMFNNSHSIEISNVHFVGTSGEQSKAIGYIQSTGSITNCSFSGGRADYGGAVNMLSSDITFTGVNSYTGNTAEISGGAVYAEDCRLLFSGRNNFTLNRASTVYSPSDFTIGGGALHMSHTQAWLIGFTNFVDNGPINEIYILCGGAVMLRNGSNLTIEGRAMFSNNSADSGAGLFSVNSSLSIMGEVSFVENSAKYSRGGAIFAFNSVVLCRGDVSFQCNHAVSGGGLFVKRSALTFQERVTFKQNEADYGGGGTYALESNVTTSGRVSFVNNTTDVGGAMAFEGSEAQLILHSPIIMDFRGNQAYFVGGGIYFLDSIATYVAQCQYSPVDIACFFKVGNSSNKDVHLNFVNNSAIDTGSVLYGGALQLCQVETNGGNFRDSLQFFRNISTFEPSDDRSSISSLPLKVCFCENDEPLCSGERWKVIRVYRGQQFKVSLITVGVFDTPVRSQVRANLESQEDSSELSTIYYSYHPNEAVCSSFGFQLMTKADSRILTLSPEGPCGPSVSAFTLRLVVQFEPCPPGFEPIRNHCKCDSRLHKIDKNRDGNLNCDINIGLVERPGKSWIKPLFDDNNSFVFVRECPVGHCKNNAMLDLSSNATDYQCTENRTGMVCGGCKEGYSLILNKHLCRKCFLALILVFAVAGIGLIAFLLSLHMTVAAGTINGLILYANIVNICRDTFFPPEKTTVNPLTLFIAWLNLDFGIPTCFYDGLTAYAYAWLQFVFPLYLWFLIGLIIYLSKRSAKIVKLFGSNPVAVLATVMSYTKLLQTSVEVLSYTNLEHTDGTREKRWRSDPNVPFLGGKHVALAIFSLCVILLLLFPYILLLMLPLP